MDRKEKRELKKAINENFSLTIDHSGSFLVEDGDETNVSGFKSIAIDNENDRQEIMKTILDFIERNSEKFSLGDLVHYNGGSGERPWWSPILEDYEEAGIIAPGSNASQTRTISHNSGNFIHPAGLTPQEYQILKTRVPEACWIEGCSNNHKDSRWIDAITVQGNICNYHRRKNREIPPLEHFIVHPSAHSAEETKNEILFFISEIIEIINENEKIVQRGKKLGISLEGIDPNESNKLNLIDLDVDWNHDNNNEARKIYINIFGIYQKNLDNLASFQNPQQNQNNNDTLNNLIKEGKNCQNNEELIEIIAKIENFHGEKIYELHFDEIQEIKNRLFNQKSSAYSNNIYQVIIKEMTNKKVTEDELSTKIKSELNKLKNQTISNKSAIDEIQKEILDEINQIAADKKIDNFLREHQQANSENERKKIIQKIQSFVIESDSNRFLKNAYQKQKTKIDKILGKNNSNQTTNVPKKDKWLLITPIVITFSILVLLLISTIIIRKKEKTI
jgi:multisubunit Na+/H+ antiporter MnhC subunit